MVSMNKRQTKKCNKKDLNWSRCLGFMKAMGQNSIPKSIWGYKAKRIRRGIYEK